MDDDKIRAAHEADLAAAETEMGQDRQFELDQRHLHLAHGHAGLHLIHAKAEAHEARARAWSQAAALLAFTRTVGFVALILTCAYIARPFLPW